MSTTKVFITKYCLTDKIVESELDIKENGYAYGKYKQDHSYSIGFTKKDYFLTKEEALQDAENRRLKKIKSLNKQIEKLNKLSFK